LNAWKLRVGCVSNPSTENWTITPGPALPIAELSENGAPPGTTRNLACELLAAVFATIFPGASALKP
jgi:hypothetical protein